MDNNRYDRDSSWHHERGDRDAGKDRDCDERLDYEDGKKRGMADNGFPWRVTCKNQAAYAA
ncbi:MAG: hypothetical protein J7D60_07860 [Prosthecochloris sp.]|jgi:hypothetical protein|nr:hypothetical protein [Prosthecochloris sp.]